MVTAIGTGVGVTSATTGAVGTFGVASTGTAISFLSGATATGWYLNLSNFLSILLFYYLVHISFVLFSLYQ